MAGASQVSHGGPAARPLSPAFWMGMAASAYTYSLHRQLIRAFEDAPAVIAVHHGPEHRFVFANKRFIESSDGRQLVGRTYADAFPEFVAQGYLAILDEVYRTGVPFIATAARADTPRTPGGVSEERYWNLTFQANRDDEGRIDGLTTFSFEVTEHVLARRGAEAAEARYDELVNTLGVVVWGADPRDWRILWRRGASEAVYGETAAATCSAHELLSGLDEEGRAALGAARSRLQATGDAYVIEGRRPGPTEGEDRWFSERVQLRLDPSSGRLVAWGLAQDVTDRHLAEREQSRLQTQLVQMQKSESLGTLAGSAAHDFNNLLTAILGHASLAELQVAPGTPASRSITALISASRRASDLTRQLLAFSGRGHFQVAPTDINALLGELTTLLHASIPKHVELRLEQEAGLPSVDADSAQLTQVFMNLVINGAEAVGEGGGTVLIRTGTTVPGPEDIRQRGPFSKAKPGRYVSVEVSDNGHGFDADTAARIFDPFFTTKPTGHGLGLATVQGILRRHSGIVAVYSEPGRGTTFKVFLPAGEGEGSVGAELPPAAGVSGRPTVLVVDDEPSVRGIARAALEFGGYQVVEANDGHEGVEAFRSLPGTIDLVLLDLTRPRLNGAEALAQIRAVRADTPVILSSGYNEVEATHRLVDKGNVDFLQKPYSVRDLLDLAARLRGARAPA